MHSSLLVVGYKEETKVIFPMELLKFYSFKEITLIKDMFNVTWMMDS